MASSRTYRRSGEDEMGTIIEEKVVKVNGDIAIRRYNKGKFLGKGGFARVYEFTNIDN